MLFSVLKFIVYTFLKFLKMPKINQLINIHISFFTTIRKWEATVLLLFLPQL